MENTIITRKTVYFATVVIRCEHLLYLLEKKQTYIYFLHYRYTHTAHVALTRLGVTFPLTVINVIAFFVKC